jgi:hypothetical protein
MDSCNGSAGVLIFVAVEDIEAVITVYHLTLVYEQLLLKPILLLTLKVTAGYRSTS